MNIFCWCNISSVSDWGDLSYCLERMRGVTESIFLSVSGPDELLEESLIQSIEKKYSYIILNEDGFTATDHLRELLLLSSGEISPEDDVLLICGYSYICDVTLINDRQAHYPTHIYPYVSENEASPYPSYEKTSQKTQDLHSIDEHIKRQERIGYSDCYTIYNLSGIIISVDDLPRSEELDNLEDKDTLKIIQDNLRIIRNGKCPYFMERRIVSHDLLGNLVEDVSSDNSDDSFYDEEESAIIMRKMQIISSVADSYHNKYWHSDNPSKVSEEYMKVLNNSLKSLEEHLTLEEVNEMREQYKFPEIETVTESKSSESSD